MTRPRTRAFGAGTAISASVLAIGIATPALAYQVTRDIPFNSPGSWPAGITRLDAYTPDSGVAPNAPTIIDIHGGSYVTGDKRDDAFFCARLADAGFNVISINYTLATLGSPSFPQAFRDVKAAIRWVRTDGAALGLSPTIVLTGTSAGSTVGVGAAYSQGVADFELLPAPPNGGYHVNAVVAVSGRYDLVWDATTNGTPPPLLWYLGGPITNAAFRPLFTTAAAITYVDACTPPTKLVHGDADPIVPYQHSVRLAAALNNAGVYNTLQIIPGAGHGSGALGNLWYVADLVAAAIPPLLAHQAAPCNPSSIITPPANDACENAPALLPGTSTAGTTLGATGTAQSPCGGGADTRDVWYAFVPPLTRRYTLDTLVAAPAFDSTLALYSDCAGAVPVGCDGGSAGPWCARLQAPLTAGHAYLVRIAGVNGDTGPFMLNIDTGSPVAPPPANDDCDAALTVGPGPYTGTTVGAGPDPDTAPNCGENALDDVWFRFVSPAFAAFRFDTEGSGLLPDTTVTLYDGCGGQLLGCNDDGGPGQPFARVELSMTGGQAVLIRIAGNHGSQGPFRLNIVQVPRPDQGACCRGQECDLRTAEDCSVGTWFSGATCATAPCRPPPPPGACCRGTTCALVTDAAACAGSFVGVAAACGQPGNPTTCCPANFNHVGGVTVQDIFDFLAAYFGAQPAADFNASGAPTVQDIFDFLGAYFSGCP